MPVGLLVAGQLLSLVRSEFHVRSSRTLNRNRAVNVGLLSVCMMRFSVFCLCRSFPAVGQSILVNSTEMQPFVRSAMGPISKAEFLSAVMNVPLVSVDLILRASDNRILLGQRRNRPAQGFWFVPGGRILKDERLADALVRVVRRELGAMVPVEGWRNMGIYEHLYSDNFAGADGISTHYVVLPHRLDLDSEVALESDDQHEALRWFSVDELMAHDAVHPYTKAYFARPAEPLDRLTDGL